MSSAQEKRLATLDSSMVHNLPAYSQILFNAKTAKKLTFTQIAKELGREEVAIAGLFYGQVQASEADVSKLSKLLDLPHEDLATYLLSFPDRGRSGPMPPKDPLVYRLYEIIQNYGCSFKAVLNEKLGDGIMSGINFTTKVDVEEDETGTYAVLTLRGKWLHYSRF